MECDQSTALVHELKTLFNIGVVRDLTDGQLLERFATDRGEAAELAFAVLVERHGPMVLRVCRSVLPAGSKSTTHSRPHSSSWSGRRAACGCATRSARGSIRLPIAPRRAPPGRRARRKHEERVAATRPEAQSVKSDDLDGVLHAEIEKLPERYRAPVVLCDLEGCSHQQAARHLGWPVGTVKSRQARGREKLRNRLRRQGVVPNIALLGSGSLSIGPNPVVPPCSSNQPFAPSFNLSRANPPSGCRRSHSLQEVLKAMSIHDGQRPLPFCS